MTATYERTAGVPLVHMLLCSCWMFWAPKFGWRNGACTILSMLHSVDVPLLFQEQHPCPPGDCSHQGSDKVSQPTPPTQAEQEWILGMATMSWIYWSMPLALTSRPASALSLPTAGKIQQIHLRFDSFSVPGAAEWCRISLRFSHAPTLASQFPTSQTSSMFLDPTQS